MKTTLQNIYHLGLKEIRSLVSDKVMVLFVVYAFTLAIQVQATGTSSEVNNASIAFVDEDQSALSKELFNAFYPPRFQFPEYIDASQVQSMMDQGRFMFAVAIPPQFERDLRAGRNPTIQVNIDATAMQQAGIGAGYIRSIVSDRISGFLKRTEETGPKPLQLVVRRLFNPNAVSSWFKSVVAIINQISLLTVILTGAAVIREREHGTLEHLLVMPLTAFEIAMAKVWANSLVILVLMLLSGGSTPVESMPNWLQALTYFLPARHFVSFSQVIIYRGGGFGAVWKQFAMVTGVGLTFFIYSLTLFRKSIAVTK